MQETETVGKQFCCPSCGEQRMDWLEWLQAEDGAGEFVRCNQCGYIYEADWRSYSFLNKTTKN